MESIVSMQLCGYVALWLRNYVAMWLYGYVARWLGGYVDKFQKFKMSISFFDRYEIHIQALVEFMNGKSHFPILIFVRYNLEMIPSKNIYI